MRNIRSLASAAFASVALLASTSFGQYRGVAKFREHERNVHEHLRRLYTLDSDVLAHKKWDQLKESHANNIVVHWPDGRTSKGLRKHIEDLKAMFAYAPDIHVQGHPAKFGSDDWTCVIGIMAGSFTKAMPIGGGKTIPPTGKRFTINICMVGHWNKDGLMDEEYVFWDNQSYTRQLGITR
jgi:SnoaL-like polyketide cyclase